METLKEILNDLNLTIADLETFKLSNETPQTKFELSRAIGQMKASRASLIAVLKMEVAA